MNAIRFRSVIKNGGILIKKRGFHKGRGLVEEWPRRFLVKVRCFINGSGKWKSSCKNLIESPKLYIVTLGISDTQHNNTVIKLSVCVLLIIMQNVIIPSVFMMTVIMQNVIMLSMSCRHSFEVSL